MEPTQEHWRRHGAAKRAQLLEKNKLQSLVVHDNVSIDYYLELAQKLHDTFIQMIMENQALEVCYVAGYYMMEFLLGEKLRGHPQYATIGATIQKHVKITKQIMESIAYKIDEIVVNRFVDVRFEPDVESLATANSQTEVVGGGVATRHSSQQNRRGPPQNAPPRQQQQPPPNESKLRTWEPFAGWEDDTPTPSRIESDVSSVPSGYDSSTVSQEEPLFYDQWNSQPSTRSVFRRSSSKAPTRRQTYHDATRSVHQNATSDSSQTNNRYVSFDTVLPGASVGRRRQPPKRRPVPELEYEASFEQEGDDEDPHRIPSSQHNMKQTVLDLLSHTGHFLYERMTCRLGQRHNDRLSEQQQQQEVQYVYSWDVGALGCRPLGTTRL